MKERPILFSAPMVRSLLNCTKSQTRRIVKPIHGGKILAPAGASIALEQRSDTELNTVLCPYGHSGDRLWVRETWQGPLIDEELEEEFRQSPDYFKKPAFCAYRATDTLDAINADGEELGWRPSIHMPRWASRILLEITGVRVERLQDISEADAIAEGISADLDGRYHCGFDEAGEIKCKSPVTAYAWLWNGINGADSWAANPWVWVIEFNRMMP